MYDFLRGSAMSIDNAGRLSFDVNGVGYSLRISEQTRQQIPLDGSTVTVYARLVVRDDDLILFGFFDPAERAAFDLLTSVQQVGPAVAMSVLSHLGVSDLRRVLLTKNVAQLKKIKGVGPKSAERIALELADKVERIPEPITAQREASGAEAPIAAATEAHRALVVLGFSSKDAADALGKAVKVGNGNLSGEELLRAALTILR
jgi:Holliday junction DNA helicase RuvA